MAEMKRKRSKSFSRAQSSEQLFRPLTCDSIAAIERRIIAAKARKEKQRRLSSITCPYVPYAYPDPTLKADMHLPKSISHKFPKELTATPIEDLDKYYAAERTFIVISKGKNIFRFSATKSLWLLSPFNLLRRAAICVLVHPIFNFLVISTILVNCFLMTYAENENEKDFEKIFTSIYTIEFCLKVIARGFILEKFTYLRDPWNWLDFAVIMLAYTMLLRINLGNLGAMRAFRVLRALKTVAVIPGLKTIVGAVIESVKNLRDVIFLTLFALSVFALLGSQLYMGVLSHKCVLKGSPNMTDDEFHSYINDSDNWYPDSSGKEGAWELCGNLSDMRQCQDTHVCLPDIGLNPNFGYTSFDTFPLALLSAFRLVTQDYWENLYQMILATAGPFHIFFFILIIFLGSFYLINLILAIVAMSYDALHQEAEEEEAIAAEEEAIAAAEEAYLTIIDAAKESSVIDAKDSRRNSGYFSEDSENLPKSSDSFVKGNELNVESNVGVESSTRSGSIMSVLAIPENTETKEMISRSLPVSPFSRRRTIFHRPSSVSWRRRRHHSAYKSCIVGRFENIEESFPYADDSKASTPTSECRQRNRAVSVVEGMRWMPRRRRLSSLSPYADACSKGGTLVEEDDQLTYRSKNLQRFCFEDLDHPIERRLSICNPYDGRYIDSRGMVIDMKDLMMNDNFVLNAARRRRSLRESTALGGKTSIKERLGVCCMKFVDYFCVWNCCSCWVYIQNLISLIVFDPFMELFITLCIVFNTLFMAIDHAHMQKELKTFLSNGNNFFTGIFAFEAVFKLLALSPKYYFKGMWNSFDFFIVALSLLDLYKGGEGGWSVLRSFRLMRVFKLAKSWPTLNLLISIMLKTFGALANLTFVLGIIIFIFAVLGMQLFGKYYYINKDKFPNEEVPRWNFQDFMHSFMIVFRVLCGEWIESMWDCLLVVNWTCIPFFLATVVFGNLVMLNLFLALLLSSFGASNFSNAPVDSQDAKKLQEAIDRFSTAYKWIKRLPFRILQSIQSRRNKGNKHGNNISNVNDIPSNNRTKVSLTTKVTDAKRSRNKETEVINENKEFCCQVIECDTQLVEKQNCSLRPDLYFSDGGGNLENKNHKTEELENEIWDQTKKDESVDELDSKQGSIKAVRIPPECCPDWCYNRLCFRRGEETPFKKKWRNLRRKGLSIAEHKHFETIIIVMILISSLALTLEDVHLNDRQLLKDILYWLDITFSILFFMEMIIKWLAFGVREYFSSVWCWLDFVIVMVSLISLVAMFCGAENVSVFKIMRTLRALRPLRALSRFQGMKVVVNAFVQAIPTIFNVLLVCLILWLIFAIMGVQLFGGKFDGCMENGTLVNDTIISNEAECRIYNLTWHHPKVNFDNVLHAYLALFQVATFKGWIEIMYSAIDATKVDMQPRMDSNIYNYFYFVLFIIFGAFFTLNLFIGVLIDNFNEQKKKITGGSLDMFMTEDQKKYYNALKKMGSKKPTKAIPRPKFKIQGLTFDLVTSKKFDMVIMVFICLNMAVMACDVYQPEELRKRILDALNVFFIAVFTVECVLKVFALRFFYFKEPWNVFDFIIVIFSILSIAVKDVLENYMVSPTLLRVVRVVKIGRVLRLVKGAKGIRTLLFALVMSLPALFNICLLLFLVMFIYAIFGMFLFKDIPPGQKILKNQIGINQEFNFQTFGKSMTLLFQMSTSAGWHEVLAGLIRSENCIRTDVNETSSDPTSCLNPNVAVAYLVTYLIICFLIIINMYIAVILENYSQATEDVQEGLTDDDYDMYYEIWQHYDPDGTQFIKFSVLGDFVDALEEPLQLPKPNKFKLVSLDIPICEEEMVYCVDILDALTKDFFVRKGNIIEETAEMEEVVHKESEIYKPITSTFLRQREIFSAKIVQRFWRQAKHLPHAQNKPKEMVSKSDSNVDIIDDRNDILSPSLNHIFRSTEV